MASRRARQGLVFHADTSRAASRAALTSQRTTPRRLGTFRTSCRSDHARLPHPSLQLSFGFLERHAELLRAIRSWGIRLLVPRHQTNAIPAYQAALREQLSSPPRPLVVEDLGWHCPACHRAVTGTRRTIRTAARAFAPPRFRAMYPAWQQRGDRVVDATVSHVLAEPWRGVLGTWKHLCSPPDDLRLPATPRHGITLRCG
jgi:hypothetical protein